MEEAHSRLKGCLVILVILAIFIAALWPTGIYVDDRVAVKALTDLGFSDIVVLEKDVWFVAMKGGSESDAARFTCEATNPAGKRVTIYVFSGWLFKGATVRSLE